MNHVARSIGTEYSHSVRNISSLLLKIGTYFGKEKIKEIINKLINE